MANTQNPWFKEWFDTEYYHILYQHRDDNEARFFIQNLVEKLHLKSGSHILDLACGRGRHALFLSQLGFEVTGLDLSESNIEFAKKLENKNLHFEQGDMRKPFGENRFDYIFNLFTSFGYFDNWDEDLAALQNMARALKPDGLLVLDFMNVQKVKLGLVKEEVREIDDLTFKIARTVRDGQIVKTISFSDKNQPFQFEEKVQLLGLEDFEKLFAQSGLKIQKVFGDFALNDFEERESERLILVGKIL